MNAKKVSLELFFAFQKQLFKNKQKTLVKKQTKFYECKNKYLESSPKPLSYLCYTTSFFETPTIKNKHYCSSTIFILLLPSFLIEVDFEYKSILDLS